MKNMLRILECLMLLKDGQVVLSDEAIDHDHGGMDTVDAGMDHDEGGMDTVDAGMDHDHGGMDTVDAGMDHDHGGMEPERRRAAGKWLTERGPSDPRPYDDTLLGDGVLGRKYFDTKNRLWHSLQKVRENMALKQEINAKLRGLPDPATGEEAITELVADAKLDVAVFAVAEG